MEVRPIETLPATAKTVGSGMSDWWWLSYADPKAERGSQLLGVVLIQANSFKEAVLNSHAQKLNPGGECKGMQVPKSHEPLIPETYRNVLLNREQVDACNAAMGTHTATGA